MAHALTPLPCNSFSPGTFNHMADAPVAIMIARASNTSPDSIVIFLIVGQINSGDHPSLVILPQTAPPAFS